MFDKNTATGIFLISIILLIFNIFFAPEIPQENVNSNVTSEQIENTSENTPLEIDNVIFKQEKNTETQIKVLENEKIKISISSLGGKISSVILKEFTTHDSLPLDLFVADSSKFNLQFFSNELVNTSDLNFIAIEELNTIKMRLMIDSLNYFEYIYSLTKDDYLIDFDINIIGMENIISKNVNYMNLQWEMSAPQTEKSKSNQEMYTGVQYQYNSNNEVDYLSFNSTDEDKINSKLNWVAFKQQFFSAILIAKDGFQKPTILSSKKYEKSEHIKRMSAVFELPFNHKSEEQLNFQFYFGPNHYKTLKSYGRSFEELIPLGWGIFGWVNQYVVINIFDFLNKYFTNYGIIILLLTIIIKLVLSPFTYKAYLSQAKMKVLKPEIDKLNDKFKGKKDPMKMQQETMNLYRKAGVNPMGGCLPMLFQFPILIAMFRFFPASIELRQKSFLWADDLSSYDSIMSLPFEIPFYGDHVSLFTLLMTISTLMYTRMNTSMATGQMAQMKWMMYLMPIMFLGFFNNYAAGLSYYYFLANMITFSQQFLMKRMIDENAILAQIEKNKKNPKKKSSFQKKLEELQKRQEAKMKRKNSL
tara:strand:+ start:1685 stop:3445 length:1761 start_codon:yes stop_codon:yes gene_type:complete